MVLECSFWWGGDSYSFVELMIVPCRVHLPILLVRYCPVLLEHEHFNTIGSKMKDAFGCDGISNLRWKLREAVKYSVGCGFGYERNYECLYDLADDWEVYDIAVDVKDGLVQECITEFG